ncbi:hypothetical protein SLS62_005505 [Diatrype stigma]|uniref:Uncharacterized protein n=1 Tax=Diatrype stigma TaxID=117547 RepID=A0AAN9YS41_9PEZI
MAGEENAPAVHNQVPEKTGTTTLPKLARVPKGMEEFTVHLKHGVLFTWQDSSATYIGSKVVKRRMVDRAPSTHAAHRIYINPQSPFRSVTARVRKQLDKNLRQASSVNTSFTNRLAGRKNASLDDRVRTIQRHHQQQNNNSSTGVHHGTVGLENSGEVLVLATGRAIERAVRVASFFQKQRDCIVQLRTSSIGAIDDVVVAATEGADDEDVPFGGGDETRKRMVSCLEVSIKLR